MYRIRMRQNKDFSEKMCFFSLKNFSPDKLAITIEKKSKGKFEIIGFVSPAAIKHLDDCISSLYFDEEEKGEYIDAGCYLELCIDFAHDYIFEREEKIDFLQSIIDPLNQEIQEREKLISKQESVMPGLKKTRVRCPTLKEYREALSKQGR